MRCIDCINFMPIIKDEKSINVCACSQCELTGINVEKEIPRTGHAYTEISINCKYATNTCSNISREIGDKLYEIQDYLEEYE